MPSRKHRQLITVSCPPLRGSLHAEWGCPEGQLGPELLADPGFLGASGAWTTYLKEPDGASFSFTGNGVAVDAVADDDETPWHVQLTQPVSLDQGGATESFYSLCIQASSMQAGKIQFAVDADGALNFAVAGGGVRAQMRLAGDGRLRDHCFSFRLGPSEFVYQGRVALDLGAVKDVEVCHASLKRCTSRPSVAAIMPVRRCYLAPLSEGPGCTLLDRQSGATFQRRELGRMADGHLATQAAMNDVEALLGRLTTRYGDDVFSELCEYDETAAGRRGTEKRSPVYVQLWEWNFDDIAKECVNYLGPNGIDAVQVSPVTEHILGSEWYTKYQPIGFGLHSRSGSKAQFAQMIAKCRGAGVQVIVDVILNHIAAPCQAAIEAGGAAVMPCKGWAGSAYGNRRINSQDGWKGPELFHNRQEIDGNRLGNCPVEEPSFTCPQSEPPGDCTRCDFKGLPDWNTGLQPTRDILTKHLTELHDLGVTMLRLDAASYVSVEDLAVIINELPWDLVYQEWWGGVPLEERTVAVGHYRDQKYGLKITNALGVGDVKYMPELLNISHGIDGISPERAVYPLTFHDQRTLQADRFIPTFKNGLEFHQQQKFLLAWPSAVAVRLFGGFTFTNMDAGPPGNCGNGQCQPFPVYMFNDAEPRCMPTPTESPLATSYEGWVCEHRWEGIAGLVAFRKACRGQPITQTWSESTVPSVGLGHFAFRAGGDCFAALVRGDNTRWPNYWGDLGPWRLAGLAPGLPPGRYCDMASLTTLRCWDRRSCPREVVIGSDGSVVPGTVPKGDLMAIYAGGRLDDTTEPFVCNPEDVDENELSKATAHMIGQAAIFLLLVS
ncbi:amy [Symbiodinium sp. KB8]|nr:amy [Symbiodinium sp. KB8]